MRKTEICGIFSKKEATFVAFVPVTVMIVLGLKLKNIGLKDYVVGVIHSELYGK